MRKNLLSALLCCLLFSICLCVALYGCGTKHSDMKINYRSVQLLPNETVQLAIEKNVEKITWSSNASDVVTVSESGFVTAISFGNALVVATTENFVFECEVSVVSCKTGDKKAALVSTCVDELSKSAKVVIGKNYSYDVQAYNGSSRVSVEEYSLISDFDGIEINTANKTISAIKNGTGKITLLINDMNLKSEYNVITENNSLMIAEKTELSLLTPKGLQGQEILTNVSATINLFDYNRATGEKNIINKDKVTFSSSDENIVAVDESGDVFAKDNGNAEIICEKDGQVVKVNVTTYCPIYDAGDMDILSLVTYEKSFEDAKKFLSQNYLLMNDIDYVTHKRNYILPIASATVDSVSSNDYSPVGYSASTLSYYSLAWKEILSLKDKEKISAENVKYHVLYINEEEEFKGINPNALSFTGIFDGNGYAIKNAWYMFDNLLGQHWTVGWTGCYYSFIGLNDGVIRNLEFNNVKIPGSATRCINGKYYDPEGVGLWGNPSDNPQAFHNIYLGMTDSCTNEEYKILLENAPLYASVNHSTVKTGISGRNWGNNCETSAMCIVNNGNIENINYSNVITARGSMHNSYKIGNGLTVVNNGIIEKCVVGITFDLIWIDVVNNANAFATVNTFTGRIKDCFAYVVNESNITNLEVQKVYIDAGKIIGECPIYDDLAEFNSCIYGYNIDIWDFFMGNSKPCLKDNTVGIETAD